MATNLKSLQDYMLANPILYYDIIIEHYNLIKQGLKPLPTKSVIATRFDELSF